MTAQLLAVDIDGGPFLFAVYAVAVLAGVALIARRPTWRWSITVLGAAAAGLGFGYLLCWLVGDVMDAFGFSLTPVSRMWVAFLCAGIALAIVNLVSRPAWRRVVSALCVAAVALACAVGLNVDAGAYRDVGQALGIPGGSGRLLQHLPPRRGASAELADADWRPEGALPASGREYSVRIPGTVSHFQARNAEVYLPPAALTRNPPALPVVIAFSGQPGSPSDLFELGRLGSDLDAYARQHHGIAPIVVSPDQLGAPGRNPMCVDSPLGDVASYVTTDVVGWVRSHLNVESGRSAWGLLGFSEGATCANQFLAGYPQLFSAELSISSELAPWNGAKTVAEAFHGSASAYAAAAPEALLRAGAPFRGDFAEFAVGGDDTRYRPNAVALAAAAKAAGMTTTLTISPGSAHDWNTVRYALEHGLGPLIEHLGNGSGSR